MKINKLILLCIFALAILTLSCVSADENITDIEPQESVKISNYTYEIEVPEGNVTTLGYGAKVSGLPDDASGNISMSVDEKEYYNKYVSPNDNRYDLNTLNLPFGPHTASIKYTGDEKYEGFIKTSNFNFAPVIIDVPSKVYIDDYDRNSININIADGVTGHIKIVIDGKTCLNRAISPNDKNLPNDENDEGTGGYHIGYSLNNLAQKTHTYEVTYSKGNTKSITKKGSFKTSYLFNVENKNTATYGEDVEFKLDVISNAKSDVSIRLNNKTYKVRLNYGYGEITLSDFHLGENDISFTYKDKNNPERTVVKTVTVLPNITLPDEISYNDNHSITLTVPKDCTGFLNVSINDENHSVAVNDGKATFSLNGLVPNKYNVHASYMNYSRQSIMNVKPSLNVPLKMWSGQSYEVEFIAPENYSGTLVLKGLVSENISVVNGSAKIKFSNLKKGNYKLKAQYVENGTALITWKFNIEVYDENPKWDLNITFPKKISKSFAGYDIQPIIVENIPQNMGGKFDAYIDGKFVVSARIYDMGEYYFNADLAKLSLGNHTLEVIYSGDGYYHGANQTTSFEIVNVLVYANENQDRVSIEIPEKDTGSITVYVDNKKVKTFKFSATSEMFYDYELKTYKKQNVKVVYSGKYGKITENLQLNPTFTLYCNDRSFEYNDNDMTYYFTLPEDAKNKVKITVDGVNYKHDFDEGFCEIDVFGLTPGEHLVEVKFLGDGKYPAKNANATIYVLPTIKEPYWVQYGEVNYFNLSLPADARGNLTLYAKYSPNDEYVMMGSSSVENGFVQVQIPTDEIGTLYYLLTFDGNYEVESYENEMEVYAYVNYPNQITYGSGKNITFRVKNSTDGYLVIKTYMDEDIYTQRFTGDTVIIPLSILDIGDYREGYLLIEYYENGKFVTSDYLDILVKPIRAKLVGGADVSMYYSDSKTYCIKIWGDYGKVVGAGETVTFKIGSKTYSVKTDKNGYAKIKLTQTPGTYTIKATYHGVSVTNKIKVKQVLTLKKVKVRKYARKLVISATLKKGKKAIKGKKITFKFKGKKYTAKTNRYGIAKITIKKSVLKKLKVSRKITYTATYLKATVKKTVKVKR